MGRAVDDTACHSVDWTQLKQIQNEQFRLKLGSFAQQALAFFYDIVLEFVRIQSEVDKYKTQMKQKISNLSCNECAELKKRIAVQDEMLASLGSSIMKVTETRHLESHISEVMKILSSDDIIPTPPPEEEKNSPKITIKVEKSASHKSNNGAKNDIKSRTENNIVKQVEVNKVTTVPSVVKAEKDSMMSDNSDVSIMDDSIYEIHGTPTGRTSPILRAKVKRSRQEPQFDQTTHSKRTSLNSKMLMLSTRGSSGGSGRHRQMRLVGVARTRRVDLTGSEIYGGGVRRSSTIPKLEFMKTSTEDDDVILPSPTSESIRNFSALGLTSRSCSPPPRSDPPPLTSQDETRVMVCDVDFDEPFDSETVVDASPNLLEGYQTGATEGAPPSPVLCENRNAGNVRAARVRCDTDASVSVLRPLRRARSDRENDQTNLGKVSAREGKSPSPKKAKVAAVERGAAGAGDATVSEADSSVSLLRRCGAAAAETDRKRPEPTIVSEKRVEEGAEFMYKEEVVRKRAERRQLAGWGCEECERYYEVACGGDPERLRRAKGACSRHRGRFDPAPAATPPGFWDMHLSVPDDTHHFNRLNGVE